MLPIRLPNTLLARRQQAHTPSPTEPKVQVRPLTKDSLEVRQNVPVTSSGYGYQTRNKISVLDGSVLPNKFEPFPKELYGKPLEEIDNFIFDEVSEFIIFY